MNKKEDFELVCKIFKIPYGAGTMSDNGLAFLSHDVLENRTYQIYAGECDLSERDMEYMSPPPPEVQEQMDELNISSNGDIILNRVSLGDENAPIMVSVMEYIILGNIFTVVATEPK